MKRRDQYLRVVEWSEEDKCYIGRIPGLALGGVHGKNEAKVYERLSVLIDEWITIHEEDNAALPPATAGKKYSGKFNLRLSPALHECLTIESLKVNESLNTYCMKVLKRKIGLQ